MAPENKKPDLSPQPAPEKQPPGKQERASTPEVPVDLDFNKKVDAKREIYEKKTEEIRKRYDSLGSIGKDQVELINARQINRLRLAAQQKKDQFKALMDQEKAQRLELMLGETEQDLIDIYFPYEKIIDYVKKMGKIDDADLAKIDALMAAMVKLKTNPTLEKLFYKVLNKEKLGPQEMIVLVNQITPMPIQQDLEKIDPKTLFEAGQTGAIIAVMSDAQRLELVELIFKNKPLQDASAIFENFLTAGIISNLQLQNLLNHKTIPEPYASQLRQQMEKGDLAKLQREYQQKLNRLTALNKGRNADNVVNKTFGSPLMLAAAGIWGIATALVNLKMNFNWDHPLESLAEGVTNPYFLLGASTATVGVVGSIKIADPETYGEYKEKFVDFFSGPEKLQAKKLGRKEELQTILETELTKNPYLMEFLTTTEKFPDGQKKCGMEVVQDLVKAKMDKKQPVDFSYQEILALSGPQQKDALAKAYGALGSKDINFKDTLRGVMAIVTGLHYNTRDQLLALTTDLKKKQGVA